MRHISQLITALAAIHGSRIDTRLKSEIRATWLRVFFLKRYDARRKVARVVGFDVRFLDYRSLSQLYTELFLKNEYHFIAERDDPRIIDGGSNIGMSILYFKMLYPNSRILAFEPGTEAFLCLEDNVKSNHLSTVTAHNLALSRTDGVIDFYYDAKHPGSLRMSTIQERMPRQRRTVPASPLSKHIDEEVDFLKLDVEGAERDVIEDLRHAGKLRHVKQMAIEYHHHIARESDDLARMLTVLEDAGFGYQIQGHLGRPLRREQFQDVLLYAYRKTLAA